MDMLDEEALDEAYEDAYSLDDNSPYLAHHRALAGVQRAVLSKVVAWLRKDQGANNVLQMRADEIEAQARGD